MHAEIYTVGGRQVDVWNPAPGSIDIDDIAHSLAAMPRFAGHTREHYSVAQHAVWVSQHVPPELAMYGLLRSAPHAYMMDLLGPVKRELPIYTATSARLAHTTLDRFGLDPFMAGDKLISAIDDLALLAEWRDQKEASLNWWGVDARAIENLDTDPAWAFDQAKSRFLSRFQDICDGLVDDANYRQARDSIKNLRGWRPPLRPEIVTWSGRAIDPFFPSSQDICIQDIARSLSRMPRFAGHTRRPYSVAEHCLFVARYCDPKDQLKALLHDATESIFLDLPTPLKRLMPSYKQLEHHAQDNILAAFGLEPAEHKPPSVARIDKLSSAAEMRDLMRLSSDAWAPHAAELERVPTIKPRGAAWAEQAFIAKFEELTLGTSAPRIAAEELCYG